MNHFLSSCKFLVNNNELSYEENISSFNHNLNNIEPILPDDLNNFYINVNPVATIRFRIFNFISYKDISNQIMIGKKIINIGTVYQGMGYNVKLYYNLERDIFFFINSDGSSYYDTVNNIQLLNNVDENSEAYEKYYFRSFISVLRYIYDNTNDFEDAAIFLNSDKVIT